MAPPSVDAGGDLVDQEGEGYPEDVSGEEIDVHGSNSGLRT